MPTSTVTSKGQITLPRDVRRTLGLDAGDKVDFVESEGGYTLVPVRNDIRSLKGRFAGRAARPASLDEMEDAIARAATERGRA